MTYDHNKEQEQFKRNEELVEREVYACVTPMAVFILESCYETPNGVNAPFSWDDVENLYREPECEHEDGTRYPECDCDAEPQEVYEWWAVSPWLYEELKAQGEPVIDTFPHLWGRTTTGQAIAVDGVISRIERKHREEVER